MPATKHVLSAAVAASAMALLVGGSVGQARAAGTHNVWAEVAPMTNPDYANAYTAATGDPNGLIYVAGGEDDLGYYYEDFSSYDTATNVWTSLAPLPEDTASAAIAAGPNDMVFVMGGYTDNGGPHEVSAVYGYSPKRDIWIVEPSMPDAREDFAAATGPDGRIYIMGGGDGAVDAYNPTTMVWSTVASPPGSIGSVAVTGGDGRIYSWAASAASSTPVYAYDVYTNIWTRVANIPTSQSYCAALASNGRIYAVAATATTPKTLTATTHAYGYDVSTNKWTRVASLPWRAYESCASIPTQPHIYAMGGYAMAGYYPKARETNTVLQYTP
jgi:N-acetylneuraminic acid mutarotase